MGTPAVPMLAIVLREDPAMDRTGRSALDVALAAASLEWPLRLYFIGTAIGHLVPLEDGDQTRRDMSRAWSALSELTDVHAWFVPQDGCTSQPEVRPATADALSLQPLPEDVVAGPWRHADRVMVL